LQYVLPTQTGKKEFCSETCIVEYRKAYSKGCMRLKATYSKNVE